MPGIFLDFELNFNKLNPEQQAVRVLEFVASLYQQGHPRIGITYSANREQAQQVRRCYNSQSPLTGIGGANQAQVIEHIERLLKSAEYQHLQGVFYILPITTCEFAGGSGRVDDAWLNDDFQYIENFLQEGGVVLGWQNQNTKHNANAPYAVGGGVSKQLTPKQSETIQNSLKHLKLNFLGQNDSLIQQNDIANHPNSRSSQLEKTQLKDSTIEKHTQNPLTNDSPETTFLNEFNNRKGKTFRSYWKKHQAVSIQEIIDHALGAHNYCLFGYSGKGTRQYFLEKFGILVQKGMTAEQLTDIIRQRV